MQRFNESASLEYISKVFFYPCILDRKDTPRRLSKITFPIISLVSQPLRGVAAIHLAIIGLIFLYHALNKPTVVEFPNRRPPRRISIKQTGKNTSIFLVWLNETQLLKEENRCISPYICSPTSNVISRSSIQFLFFS